MAGAALLYFYFNWVDPWGLSRSPVQDLVVFMAVTGTIVVATFLFSTRLFGSMNLWRERLRRGADPAEVPPDVRRRALNRPLINATFSMTGWVLAGLFYFPYQTWVMGLGIENGWRVFSGIVFVGGPVASSLAFLVSEYYSRRDIPLFFPDGRVERRGVLRVPILLRLGATFLLTAVLPPMLMMMVSFGLFYRFGGELPEELLPLWMQLLRTQTYIVGATGIMSLVMAMLVARFINRPVQALRTAMVRVARGELDVNVPVRSTDELGELNEHFNEMVGELRDAERMRVIFGRYVSTAVARQALERGIALGGELTRATAMFADLRGFTALTQRAPAGRVVELLNEYYAIVERVCERQGGIITQFLGDGVVVVFGGPLRPLPDHARRAVAAAVALQQQLGERNGSGDDPLLAGIGICTGDMIAGNVGAGDRITYTIVGDAVNQAARLQVKTRDLGAAILLTESTRAALDGNGFALRPVGAVPLKGIAAPVEVYAVEPDYGFESVATR
ncbi:MAG TPA: adenylate/guanylate cyclase domain-containing protein [Candidatus Binatia bacterium]|nr:adenylate/guanylate cyclase domain-containing protein [Candidatus Binatia bacterium]